jgi:hypothetical protein
MSFKDYETALLNTYSVSKFYKSWIIFYRCGLVDVDVRRKIKFEGYMPWNNVDSGNWNYFPSVVNQIGENRNLEEGKRELNGMFMYWKRSTLLAEEFEVYDTSCMGLGVRVTRSSSDSEPFVFFRVLSLHALHGFLEIIPQSLFEELRIRGHNSLYKFYHRSSRKWIFAILFGPLSLVNSQVTNSIGFCSKDTQLRTLVWELTFSWGLLFCDKSGQVSEVESFQCRYYDSDEDDSITEDCIPSRLKYGTVIRLDSTEGNSIARKRSYVMRVVMRHRNPEDEVNIRYSNFEEVFIDYDFV